MDTAKFFWLTYIVILSLQNVVGHKYQTDQGIAGFTCSAASLNAIDLRLAVSLIDCAARCSKADSCLSFFYGTIDGICLGSLSVIESSTGCAPKSGMLFFKTIDISKNASTTSTTIPTITSTTFTTLPPKTTTTYTTLPPGQHGDTCLSNAGCSRVFSVCLMGSCLCQAGYRHETASGSCVTDCSTYGSTYIRYPDMDLNVAYISHAVTLAQCFKLCMSSPACRGFTFCNNWCWLKDHTPLTDPTQFMTFPGVDYYSRNCV